MGNENSHNNNNYICISPDRGWTDLRLDEVWRYRDLIVLFTKRSFTLTYAQTILGPLWLFLNPFLTSVMFTLVFGYIAGIQTDGVPKFLFFLCSTAVWNFYSACISENALTFIQNAYIFGKVYFPRLTIPLSQVVAILIRFLIQISMVLVLIFYWNLVYHDYRGLLSKADYSLIEQALNCLYGSTCLIPYPDYLKMGKLHLGQMEEIDFRLQAIENTNLLPNMGTPWEIDRSYKYPHLWYNQST